MNLDPAGAVFAEYLERLASAPSPDLFERYLRQYPDLADPLRELESVRLAEEAASTEPAAVSPGDRLGRYVVCEMIGAGGMGAVYRAIEEDSGGREVALKVCRSVPRASPRFRADFEARFRREVQITAAVRSPGIPRVFEFGVDELGRQFYAMELVVGEPLDRVLARMAEAVRDGSAGGRPSLSLVARLEVLARVARVVAAAHAAGIIHRDIKPSNIVLSEGSGAYVIDWGLAVRRGELEESSHVAEGRGLVTDRGHERLSLTGAIIGTPSYMAPEQARGELTEVDERSDVYGLGAMLFELLFLEPPHVVQPEEEQDATEQLLKKAARGVVNIPSACADLSSAVQDEALYRPDLEGARNRASEWVPQPLLELLRGWLASSPRTRPSDAGEAADAIEAFLRDGDPKPPPALVHWESAAGQHARSVLGSVELFLLCGSLLMIVLIFPLAVLGRPAPGIRVGSPESFGDSLYRIGLMTAVILALNASLWLLAAFGVILLRAVELSTARLILRRHRLARFALGLLYSLPVPAVVFVAPELPPLALLILVPGGIWGMVSVARSDIRTPLPALWCILNMSCGLAAALLGFLTVGVLGSGYTIAAGAIAIPIVTYHYLRMVAHYHRLWGRTMQAFLARGVTSQVHGGLRA